MRVLIAGAGVIGKDGFESSKAALRWAIHQAKLWPRLPTPETTTRSLGRTLPTLTAL